VRRSIEALDESPMSVHDDGVKETLTCPKCDSRRLWMIDRLRAPSETLDGQVLPVVWHQAARAEGFFALQKRVSHGHFAAYICARCGLTELWADGLEDLKADPDNGILLIDNTDPAHGPFR